MGLALSYSDDEAFIVIVSCVLWLVTWFVSYRELAWGPRLRREPGPRLILGLAPPLALLVLLSILRAWSSFDVQESPAYLFQYLALGAAWLGVAARFHSWFGISVRDDVAERGNPAAAVALSGAWLGLVLCYAGGNIGDGPGWWVVVFSSGIASAVFYAAWLVLELAAHPSESITIDRDLAAAARHVCYGVAMGAILGRAAAGDWVSAKATLRDFCLHGWPALVVLALDILFQRPLRPSGAERAPPQARGSSREH